MRRTAEIEQELASRVDQRVLRWFADVERMDESLQFLGRSGTTVEAVRQCTKYRNDWRALAPLQILEFHETIFAGSGAISDRPPAPRWIIT